MLSITTVLLYGVYLVLFSLFVAISILIIGVAIKEVRNSEEDVKIMIDGKVFADKINK